MPTRNYANAPATTLATSCTALATSIEVTATTGFPIAYPYSLIIDRGLSTEEAVSVTAASGTTLTVTRGIDGTSAFAHAAQAAVAHGITAQDIREANAHVNANSGVHGVTGSVVGTTDTQTLTNKTLTSPVMTGNPTAPTPATSDSDVSVATTAFVKAALLAAHPVGDIKMSTVNVNPSTYLGGTWIAWGSGRVPVGVDAAQAEFNTVEETGGAKTHTLTEAEMPVHDHPGDTGTGEVPNVRVVSTTGTGYAGNHTVGYGAGAFVDLTATDASPDHTHPFTTDAAGGGDPHNNLQPYITCYMFKRTA